MPVIAEREEIPTEPPGMKQSQRIVKNIVAGAVGVGLGGLLQLVAVVYLARSVGVTVFGTYAFILAFALFFQILADSGLSNILVRELATKPQRMREILGAAMALIWALSLAVMVLLLIVIPFLHFSLEIKLLTALMGVATLTTLHASGYGAALRSQEDNELHSLGFLLHKVVFCICIFVVIQLNMGLTGVVVAHLIPNLFLRSFYKHLVSRRYIRPKLSLDYQEWKYLLTHSLPVGGATMLRLLSQQIDVVILRWMTDWQMVGLFSGPYRVTMALRFIPQTMSIPLYPMYSRLAIQPDAKAQLQAAYERSVKFFLVSGCAVATVFVACAKPLITLLLGAKYESAAPTMQILGAAFVPFFVSNPVPFLLTALHEQRFLLWATIIALALRIGLNVALIPPFGFTGPAISFLVGEIVILVLMLVRLRAVGFPLPIFEIAWRPLVASAFMGLVLVLTRQSSLIASLPGVIAACAVYLALIFKLGTFSADELGIAREGFGFIRPMMARWAQQPVAEKAP